jgi:amino ABC transporter, permease protein, 3-TM region, his/glu/gln/arg/opine family|nr:amino acid ABC transporter permease [uncultured Stomatobaculum sp.]
MFQSFADEFYRNFIFEQRWRYLSNGLLLTLEITFFAVLLGVLLGFSVALVREAHRSTGKFRLLSTIGGIYLTVIRGTPVVVQLMLIYFGIFASVRIPPILVAIIAFGINSGAYQAEIFRSGIEAVPRGQFEAGRSLGFSYWQTMRRIIMPQAMKNVIPTLANEFIVLLKETSVAGYVALADLTKGGDIIRSRTYSPYLPMLAVALIYLCLVMIFSAGVKYLERSLKTGER